MLNKFIIIISGFLFPLILASQEFYPISGLNNRIGKATTIGINEAPFSNPGQSPGLNYSLSTGMSFISWKDRGSVITQFISPAISARISGKFRVSGGVHIRNMYIRNPKGSEIVIQEQPGAITTTAIWLSGKYQVNPNLGFSGTLYKDFAPKHENSNGKIWKAPQGEGFLIDMQYRPSRNFEINAGFGYQRGNSIFQRWGETNWGISPSIYSEIFETGPGF